jgi:hypothetical protein
MPLGILQDYKLEHVPGTAPLSELGRIDVEISTDVDRGLLKHDATGQIVLVPQPSDSPNDPYNWPRWKKEMVCLYFETTSNACTDIDSSRSSSRTVAGVLEVGLRYSDIMF